MFVNECPLLRFVGKENNVSDQFGEKVSEQQVRAGLAGVAAKFMLVACEANAYTVYIEGDAVGVGERLEAALLENVHYRYCRELGQLERVREVRTTRGHERYLVECHRRGQKLGEIKPSCLSREPGWIRVFAQ